MSVELSDSFIISESIWNRSLSLIRIILAAIEAALSVGDESPLLAKTRNKVSRPITTGCPIDFSLSCSILVLITSLLIESLNDDASYPLL